MAAKIVRELKQTLSDDFGGFADGRVLTPTFLRRAPHDA